MKTSPLPSKTRKLFERSVPISLPVVLIAIILSGLCDFGELSAAPGNQSAEGIILAENFKQGNYTILILHNGENIEPLSQALCPLAEASEKCRCLISEALSPGLRPLFQELNLDPETAPTPLALAIAPNKIVTGVFMQPPTSESFQDAILPEQPLAVRKALHEGKLVIVKLQSRTTVGNKSTNTAVAKFFKSRRNRELYAALPVDLDRPENARFIRQLNLDPAKETKSILVGMGPPLKILNNPFRGAATKSDVEKVVTPCCCPPGKT